jgi:hypothetical protein
MVSGEDAVARIHVYHWIQDVVIVAHMNIANRYVVIINYIIISCESVIVARYTPKIVKQKVEFLPYGERLLRKI